MSHSERISLKRNEEGMEKLSKLEKKWEEVWKRDWGPTAAVEAAAAAVKELKKQIKEEKMKTLWIQMGEEEAIFHLKGMGYEVGYVEYGFGCDENRTIESYFIDRQFPYYEETEIREAVFGFPEKKGIIQYWSPKENICGTY